MISFLKSKEFWMTTSFLIVAFLFHWIGDLANVIQDLGLYGWSYVIWKMEKHHTIVRSLLDEDEDK